MPDDHFGPDVAARYDDDVSAMYSPAVLDLTVGVLAELAGDGAALEFAIGTGRVALPLAARGVEVQGIELSTTMVERLQAKEGAGGISVTNGDMARARVHVVSDGSEPRETTTPFRYVWPSELDLMARLAGMSLEDRWAGWDRAPFTGESTSHVSVWRKTDD